MCSSVFKHLAGGVPDYFVYGRSCLGESPRLKPSNLPFFFTGLKAGASTQNLFFLAEKSLFIQDSKWRGNTKPSFFMV